MSVIHYLKPFQTPSGQLMCGCPVTANIHFIPLSLVNTPYAINTSKLQTDTQRKHVLAYPCVCVCVCVLGDKWKMNIHAYESPAATITRSAPSGTWRAEFGISDPYRKKQVNRLLIPVFIYSPEHAIHLIWRTSLHCVWWQGKKKNRDKIRMITREWKGMNQLQKSKPAKEFRARKCVHKIFSIYFLVG